MRDIDTMVEQAMTLLAEHVSSKRMDEIEDALSESWGHEVDCYRSTVCLVSGKNRTEVEIDLGAQSVMDYSA